MKWRIGETGGLVFIDTDNDKEYVTYGTLFQNDLDILESPRKLKKNQIELSHEEFQAMLEIMYRAVKNGHS